jgi:hypothetical protein
MSIREETAWIVLTAALVLLVYCVIVVATEWQQGRLVSPLTIVAGLYTLHFALPGGLLAVGLLDFSYPPNAPYAFVALNLSIASLVAFQAGTFLARSGWGRRPPRRRRHPSWNLARLRVIVATFLLIGWGARLYITLSGGFFQIDRGTSQVIGSELHALGRFLELFPVYGYLLILVAGWSNAGPVRKRRGWLRTAIVVAVLDFGYWVIAGRKQEAILLLIYPVVAYFLGTGRLPRRRILMMAALLIVFLFPTVYYYRSAMALSTRTHESVGSVVTTSLRQARHSIGGLDDASGIVLGRLNLLEPLSASVRLIEEDVWSLRLGADYAGVFTNMVPRILWPEKPTYHYGTIFGQKAGFLSVSDMTTSISVTYLGETFLNFGRFGWLLFLLAGAIAETFFLMVAHGRNPNGMLLYLLILSPLLYIGGTAAMYTGGLIKLLVMFSLVLILLNRSLRSTALCRSWLPMRSGVGTVESSRSQASE